jgi:hypothetical protein
VCETQIQCNLHYQVMDEIGGKASGGGRGGDLRPTRMDQKSEVKLCPVFQHNAMKTLGTVGAKPQAL